VFESGERCPGVYLLQDPLSLAKFQVWCEFDDEHGWTVIQRRMDGSVDFYRGWQDYVDGFSDIHGEFWLGVFHWLIQCVVTVDWLILCVVAVDWLILCVVAILCLVIL